MNLFNRVTIILLILVMMTLIPLALIFPAQAEYALRYTADVVHANLAWLNSLAPTAYIGMRVLLIAVGGAVFVVGLLFLVLEVIRIRRKTVRLKDGSGELVMDGITGHLVYHIDPLAGILRVRPKTVSKGKSVQVSLYVETAPGTDIPAKTAEIKEVARQVIEEQLGLQLKREIQVVVKPAPYPRGRSRSRRPAAPASGRRKPGIEPMPRTETVPAASTENSEAAQEETESQIIEVKGPSS